MTGHIPLPTVELSNSHLPTSPLLPTVPVAVIIGATSGIGEATLKEFVKNCAGSKDIKPRCYLVGRNADAAARIIGECKDLNTNAEVVFLKCDVGLMTAVEALCDEIKKKEKYLNLLMLSAGAVVLDRSKSTEGLHALLAPTVYSRLLTTSLLAPLLSAASTSGHLSRVINVAGGAKEGSIYIDDIEALKVPLTSIRGHVTSVVTLTHFALQARYPSISFIQWFPGAVKTNLFNNFGGIMGLTMNVVGTVGTALGIGGWITVEECGKRSVFTSTSDIYPAKGEGKQPTKGKEEIPLSIGADGEQGSGVYSVDWDGIVADEKIVELLKKYRADGTMDKVMEHAEEQFGRILGKPLVL